MWLKGYVSNISATALVEKQKKYKTAAILIKFFQGIPFPRDILLSACGKL